MSSTADRIQPAAAGTPVPPGVPHPRPMLFTIEIGPEDLSHSVPHVNNVIYLAWIDRVAELAGEAVGPDRATLAREGRVWFAARHEIDYLAEVFAGPPLVAATWIHDHRRTSCRRDTIIHRADDDTVVARARSTWAWIDLEARKPTRIPKALLRDLDPLRNGTTVEAGA